MDVLSSQSNLAGYKAVITGADYMGKIFPMLMTAAGTISPARVLIFGVGVAGLQAIATAKRLGASVEATDVRPECKEQTESLGAKFISVEEDGVKTEGGYAKEVSEEYLRKQKEAVNKSLAMADLVITTALVQGAKAPILISEVQIGLMKEGAVIVDMAVAKGGNTALSKSDEVLLYKVVKIVGVSNFHAQLPTNASELLSRNIVTFLAHLVSEGSFHWDRDDEITTGTLVTGFNQKSSSN
jgi:NAD(P) transhydrogenase subunit alpha